RAVAEAEEKLASRIIGAEHADWLQIVEDKLRGELLPQDRRQIRHLLEPVHAFLVDPFRGLFRAERRLAEGVKARTQFIERERFDRRAAGGHHTDIRRKTTKRQARHARPRTSTALMPPKPNALFIA